MFLFSKLALFSVLCVTSLYSMSSQQVVGQLFVIPLSARWDEELIAKAQRLINDYAIGGVIWMDGELSVQRVLQKRLEGTALYPLLFIQDGERGLGMRLHDIPLLEPAADIELNEVEQWAKEIAVQCKEANIMVNLAPVCDLFSDGQWKWRSFATDVEESIALYIQTFQGYGVSACAKHFPGHGVTVSDSHLELPLVDAEAMITHIEPFIHAIRADVDMIMVGHLLIGAEALPTSLSKYWVEEKLRNEMGFKGIIVPDALNMGAISSYFSIEEAACLAFDAGHDMLLYAIASHHPTALQLVFCDIILAIESLAQKVEEEERLHEVEERIARRQTVLRKRVR